MLCRYDNTAYAQDPPRRGHYDVLYILYILRCIRCVYGEKGRRETKCRCACDGRTTGALHAGNPVTTGYRSCYPFVPPFFSFFFFFFRYYFSRTSCPHDNVGRRSFHPDAVTRTSRRPRGRVRRAARRRRRRRPPDMIRREVISSSGTDNPYINSHLYRDGFYFFSRWPTRPFRTIRAPAPRQNVTLLLFFFYFIF